MSAAETRRILSVFRSADAEQFAAGVGWYETAHNEARDIAREFNLSLAQSAGIIAALSPQVSWGFNLIWAREIAAGSIVNRGLTLSMGRALMIQRNPDIDPLDILGGNKVRAFYACIMSAGITSEVCIDRHAWDIATGERLNKLTITDKRYRDASAAYVRAAERLNVTRELPTLATGRTGYAITPAQLQAVTWVTWRARYWSTGAFDPRTADRAPLGAF